MNRRNFFSGAATAVAAASVSRVALAALPEPVIQTSADTAPPLQPATGRPYNPVVTLNGWTAPWRMNAGVKEFHLVAEPVVREVAPGFLVNMWGYNGMLASVWDMLAEARNSTQAVANAIEAQRDFWLAETDLQLALTGTPPGALQGLTSGAAASTTPQGH